MHLLPPSLEKLIDELGMLPGVGPRTAERYAYYLLRADRHGVERLSRHIADIQSSIKTCPVTFALIDASQEVSALYSDSHRNKQQVAVVEDPLDVVALEKTGQFSGTYHVLGGVISPIDGVGPEQLHIKELLKRIKDDNVQEVILAMNANVEGESTALFLQKQIQEVNSDVVISRLARGIPMGIDLEYADQITLSHALEGRQKL